MFLSRTFINSTPNHEHDDADDKEEVLEDEYRIEPKDSDFKYVFDEVIRIDIIKNLLLFVNIVNFHFRK